MSGGFPEELSGGMPGRESDDIVEGSPEQSLKKSPDAFLMGGQGEFLGDFL